MSNEFIAYEQALALKELGFDEPCFAWFILEGDGAKSTLVLEKCPKQDIGLCLAPLYQQAFRWFRERHGLHRHICYFNDTNVWHGDIYKIQNEGLMNNPMELTNYKTYEEAELACLIKLIEIVKKEDKQ